MDTRVCIFDSEIQRKMYNYKAFIKQVYSGDTVAAVVDLGFQHYQEMTLRLYGVNVQDFHGTDAIKRTEIRSVLSELILNQEVEIYTFQENNGFGSSYQATIILEDLDVNQWLVQNYLKQEFVF